MPELLDIRDEHGNLTGETMMRSDVHRQELWHGIALIWVYNRSGQILMQRRAAHLNAFPEKWDVSVSGHLTASDRPSQAAARELGEELGIYIDESELEEAGMLTDSFTLAYGKQHRECDFVFYTTQDVDINTLRLQAAEVLKVRWVPADELERELADPVASQHYSTRNARLYWMAINHARQLAAQA